MRTPVLFALSLMLLGVAASGAERRIPKDLSTIRGFNYTASSATGHPDHWLRYKPEETEREMDFAVRLNLNQVRVFVPFDVFRKEKESLRKNLLHFVRACHRRGIGVMPVAGWGGVRTNPELRPAAAEYVRFLVETLSGEPGLEFWDACNEPEVPRASADEMKKRFEFAAYIAGLFREFDKKTPVTIGMASVPGMEVLPDAVDVLSFHDYSPTRARIRANIERATKFAAKVGKPVFNTEIGCVARANPYDVTLQEHMRAKVGWYIWELMITHGRWGPVHGVFYGDGTVRDPSIAAAILGFFRNRAEYVLLENADQENRVTRTVAEARKWLDQDPGAWDEGLALAETAANLLEAGQLISMRELPTRQVDLMREKQPDLPALRALLKQYVRFLEPHQLKR